jgi:threonine dehydrogenase-like Zn-dependent dehydrogenase
MRVSVMLDSNGCNTTAAAVVAKILSVGTVSGQRAVVLGGTGPVGSRTAALLAREGALVTLASRQLSRAKAACAGIRERFAVSVSPAEVADATQSRYTLQAAEIVVATGAAGVTLLPQTIWSGHPTLRILADVNAVPPSGIEGIEPTWDGCSLAAGEGPGGRGKIAFGALAIGALKKRTHYACLTRLFERNDGVFDAEAICAVAKELEGECASSSRV